MGQDMHIAQEYVDEHKQQLHEQRHNEKREKEKHNCNKGWTWKDIPFCSTPATPFFTKDTNAFANCTSSAAASEAPAAHGTVEGVVTAAETARGEEAELADEDACCCC